MCATMTPGHDPVQKVTLIPRGQAKGLTWFIPGASPTTSKLSLCGREAGRQGKVLHSMRCAGSCARCGYLRAPWLACTNLTVVFSTHPPSRPPVAGEDPSLISKQQIFARIVGALGGRAAEECVFGDAEVTTGASSDLQQVRRACRAWSGAVVWGL